MKKSDEEMIQSIKNIWKGPLGRIYNSKRCSTKINIFQTAEIVLIAYFIDSLQAIFKPRKNTFSIFTKTHKHEFTFLLFLRSMLQDIFHYLQSNTKIMSHICF